MRATRANCYGIGLVFALAGCIGVIVGLILAHKDYRLIHDGVAVNATVTALTSRQYGRGNEYEYTAFYAYQDNSGTHHAADSVIWFSEWKNLKVYGPVPILYVRTEPTENRVNLPYETKLYHDNGTLTPLFAAFIFFIGMALMVAAYFDARFPVSSHAPPIYHWWPFRRRAKTNTFHKTY